jgi:hypothetical protein
MEKSEFRVLQADDAVTNLLLRGHNAGVRGQNLVIGPGKT